METDIELLKQQRTLFQSAVRAPRTVHAYAANWRLFSAWCDRACVDSLPCSPDTLSLYACAMIGAELSFATVEARLCAVSQRHKNAGYASPLSPGVRSVVIGARRVRKRPQRTVSALTIEQLRLICLSLDASHPVNAARNRSLLLLGFACALRRSEICQLDLADLTFEPEGLRVRLRYSKTDQEGRGRDIGIVAGKNAATCPIELLRAWLRCRGTAAGPLYPRILNGGNVTSRRLAGGSVCTLVKNCVARIGLDPTHFGGHSLRSGFVTSAIEAGVSELVVMGVTGHRSIQTLARYVRPSSAFAVNPLAKVL